MILTWIEAVDNVSYLQIELVTVDAAKLLLPK